jgi:hypothetical protein
MELFTLGTVSDGEGNWSYDERNNPLLKKVVMGQAADGRWQYMGVRNFALQSSADAIARVVGGRVVRDPMSVNWTTDYPCLAVKLGERIVNAGVACMVMGNDNGETASPRQKSRELCQLFGLEPNDTLADRLYDALVR